MLEKVTFVSRERRPAFLRNMDCEVFGFDFQTLETLIAYGAFDYPPHWVYDGSFRGEETVERFTILLTEFVNKSLRGHLE